MLPRYSKRKFPSYRFIPGKTPHPTRDPDGHSFARHPEPRVNFNDWRTCENYLYGIDLFNHGYWWEAHEALETVWVTVGRKSEAGQFIQGLILLSVAHLKCHQGFTDVGSRMAREGLEKIRSTKDVRFGINVISLRCDVQEFLIGNDTAPVTIYLQGIK